MAQVNSGSNSLLWVVIFLVAVGGVFMYSTAQDSAGDAVANSSVQAASTVSTVGTAPPAAATSTLVLDSKFISLSTTDNDSAAVTIADASSSNFDEDSGVISFQLDAEVDSTTTAGYTVFTLLARNDTGVSTVLLRVNETGTLTAPTTAMTKTMTFQITEDVVSGFDTTEQVLNQVVSASAPMLKGTPTDAAALYSPIVVQTTDTNTPEVKVDGTKDTHSYLWTTATTTKTIDVTFDISFIEIDYMTDVTDRQTVTVTATGADDAPYMIELIRIAAI